MRLLFLGDIVGRPGRSAVTERLPGLARALAARLRRHQRRERGRRLRHHRGDLRRDPGRRRRRHHARQPLLRPARGAGLHRAPAAPPAPGQLSARHAGPRRDPRRHRNGARVLVVNVMGRLFMDALDDPFAAVDRELDACPLGAGRRCGRSSTSTPRRRARSRRLAYHLDGRASLVVGTHTHVPDRRLPHPARRHRLPDRCRHVRRLRFRPRHAEGGADPPLPRRRRPARGWSRPLGKAASPASPSRPTTPRALPAASPPSASGRSSKSPGRASGTERRTLGSPHWLPTYLGRRGDARRLR